MKVPDTTRAGFAEWFRNLMRNWRGSSALPSPFPKIVNKTSSRASKPEPQRSKPAEPAPDNYYFFECFIEFPIAGINHVGNPKRGLRDVGKNPPVVRWGSPIHLSWPDPKILRAPWVDDPQKGLSQRTITSPEDMLGAEGVVRGNHYRFEKVLELGKNQVAYSLFCDLNQTRIAYGFSRAMFQTQRSPSQTH
jgi:hypothetical protein